MSLYERVSATDETKIPIHTLTGYLHVWLNNSEGLGNAAGSRFVANYNLDSPTVANAQAIKSKYDAAVNPAEKVEFLGRIHAAFMLVEAGEITETELNTLMGL